MGQVAEQASVVALEARRCFWAGPPVPKHCVLLSQALQVGGKQGMTVTKFKKGTLVCVRARTHTRVRLCRSAGQVWLQGGSGRGQGPPIPHRDMTICLEQRGSPVVWIQHWVRGPSPMDERVPSLPGLDP